MSSLEKVSWSGNEMKAEPGERRLAKKLAKEVGLEFVDFYKLALAVSAAGQQMGLKRGTTVRGSLFKYEAVFVFTRNVA